MGFFCYLNEKKIILFTSLLLLSCSSDEHLPEVSHPVPSGSETVYFTLDKKFYSSEFPTAILDEKRIFIDKDIKLEFGIELINDNGIVKLYFTSYDKIKEGKSYRIHAPRLEDSFTAGNSFYNYPNISFDCGTNSKYGGVIKIVKFDLENF